MSDGTVDVSAESLRTQQAPDLVVFVHGTFAASSEEEGSRWWQRGSEHWRWLQAHLPAGVVLGDDSVRPFMWDGCNSQISRLRAANRLLALMLELERQGRNYHLIGHSHGGSVIWEALVSAEVTRGYQTVYAELRRALNDPTVRLGDDPIIPERPDEYAPWFVKYKTRYIPQKREYAAIRTAIELPRLRSWTTVGTPFMHYLPVRRPFVSGWRSRGFSVLPSVSWRGLATALTDLLLTMTVALPFIWLFVALIATAAGAAWPRTFSRSDLANSLALPFGIWWLIAFFALGRGHYAEALLARERAGLRATRRFAERWLGLWSPSDEAINALSASVRHGVTYEWLCTPAPRRARQEMPTLPVALPIPRLSLPAPVGTAHLVPDVQMVTLTRLAKPVVVLANRLLEPWWRRKVAIAVTRTAQGSDLPAAVAAYVSPWPLPLADARAYTGLPDTVTASLDHTVARQNAALGPRAREVLMIAALEGLPGAIQAAGEDTPTASTGLVHTAYFSDHNVRALILRHIRQTSTSTGQAGADEDTLSTWLTAHHQAVQERLARFLSEIDE